MVAPESLTRLASALVARGHELAVYLVYDRPERESERPGLARLHFAQRCASDEMLEEMIENLRSIGGYVEVFAGEQKFASALTSGRLRDLGRPLQIAYNGIGWGVGEGGFMPGRKALIPLLADSYNIACTNADGYACAFTAHKFHCFAVLATLGIGVPATWHYRPGYGWVGARPNEGTRVIVKSTYEAYSVGVTMSSVFDVDESVEERVEAVASLIGQPVTVQQFIVGPEVCVPIISRNAPFAAPPVEAVLSRAPGDPTAFMTINDTTSPGGYSHRLFDAPREIIERLRTTAIEVFRALDLRGLSRLDFRIDSSGQPWLFDIAIEPVISTGSSAYRSFSALGLDHTTFQHTVFAVSLNDTGLLSNTAS